MKAIRHAALSAVVMCASIGLPVALAQAPATHALSQQASLCELTSKIDTKTAKVGDPLTAKTLATLKLSDGTVLPEGSKLFGKVTQVQSKSAGTPTIAILFDQMQQKKSAPFAIQGTMVAVAPRPNLSDAGAPSDALPIGTSASKATVATLTGAGVKGADAAPPPMEPGSKIRGVVLNPKPGVDGSAILTSDKDFHLDGGTRIEVGLMSK